MRKIPLYSRPDMAALPRITGLHAIVDDADFVRVMSAARWWTVSFDRQGEMRYPTGSVTIDGKRASVVMHRFIMSAGPRQLVDHKDRDHLNNQRSNLRFCTPAQNAMNSRMRPQMTTLPARYGRGDQIQGPPRPRIPFRGVRRVGKKWAAICLANKVRHYSGRHPTPEEAARAYDAMALKYHGEFAVLNFGSAS